jgi:hypothetical protein
LPPLCWTRNCRKLVCSLVGERILVLVLNTLFQKLLQRFSFIGSCIHSRIIPQLAFYE